MNKIQIREGMYETNSSSMHTIVLRNNETFTTKSNFVEAINSAKDVSTYIRKKGWRSNSTNNNYMPIPSFTDNYFCYGHGFELLTDWEDKFYYLIASYHTFDGINEIIEVVQKRIPEIDGIITMLDTSAFDFVKGYEFLDNYDAIGSCFGSIDHQSYDTMDNLFNALSKEDDYKDKTRAEIIDEIIFSTKFVIVIDSDECDRFTELYGSGMFEKAGFTKILHGEYINREEYKMTYTLVDIDKELKEKYTD